MGEDKVEGFELYSYWGVDFVCGFDYMYIFLDVVLGIEVVVEVDFSLGDYFQVGVYNDGCEVKISQKGILL